MALAEGEGFEPPVGTRPTAVFKTAAFNRSANPPGLAANLTMAETLPLVKGVSQDFTHISVSW